MSDETTQRPVMDFINETVKGLAFRRAAEVESKLLAGANRVVVDDKFAGIVLGRIIYEVPRWRDRPIRRLRIERLRRKARAAR